MRTKEIRFFAGSGSAVDKRNLPDTRAEKELNARHEDGRLKARYGYRNLRAAQPGSTAVFGFSYLQGINSSYAEVEEYLSIETVSGSTNAYARHVETMAPTPITGATGLSATPWTALSFDSVAYVINPANATNVYRHTIGNASSWVPLQHPADPTATLTYAFAFNNDSSESGYDQLSWAGLNPTLAGEMAVTGLATNTGSELHADNSFSVRHTAGSGGGDASFEVDLDDINAGDQDWTFNDAFAFTLTEDNSGAFEIDPASIAVSMTNEDTSPITFNLETKAERVGLSRVIRVWCYTGAKTRSQWDNIGTFKVAYRVIRRSSTASNNDLTVSKLWIGCCLPAPPAERLPGLAMRFGYSYYFSGPQLESGIAGIVSVPLSGMRGYDPLGGTGINTLGTFISFRLTASLDPNVDNVRLYWFDEFPPPGPVSTPSHVWRRIVEQNDVIPRYLLRMSYEELLALPALTTTGSFLTSPVNNAFPFKGRVVWLYAMGSQNVRHSRVGEPERQHSDLDFEDDDNRGATFTLADNSADVPIGGLQVGDSAIIFGSNGAYEQYDPAGIPSQATPPKRLGPFGAAGKFAFCRYRDDAGNIGAAFVDRHGTGVWFAYPSQTGQREVEGQVVELSAIVRGRLKTFLLDEQSALGYTDFSEIEVFTDDSQDALWVKLGKRAMVLRRPNAIGEREWEFYEYNTGGSTVSIYRVAPSTKRRIRWIRSDGKTDEAEWNSADSQYIEGVGRDGGNTMPLGYWRSKAFTGQNRRINRIFLERDFIHETARVKVISNRLSQVYQLAAGKRFAPCSPMQQGFDHQFEIEIPEMDGGYPVLRWDETDLSRRFQL